MVLNSESNTSTPPPKPNQSSNPQLSSMSPTPLTNPNQSSNPQLSSSMSPTLASFYVRPHTAPINHNLASPNRFGWVANRPTLSPNYAGMNPISNLSSSLNQAENLDRPNLRLSLGPYPNQIQPNLNRNQFFCFGSETNQGENRANSILQLGLDPNREQSTINSILQLGSSSTLKDTKKTDLGLSHGFSSNQIENRDINSGSNQFVNRGINLNLNQVGKNKTNSFELFPNSNWFDKSEISDFEFFPGLNRVDKTKISGFEFHPKFNHEISGFKFHPGSNRVEKNEIRPFVFQALVSNPVEPPVEPLVEPPVEPLIEPPVELPVKPPVETPVQPPVELSVEPPVEPPVEPISEEEAQEVEKTQHEPDLIEEEKSKDSDKSPEKAKSQGSSDNKNNNGEEGKGEEEEEVVAEDCSDEESINQNLKKWNLRPRKLKPEKEEVNVSGGGVRRSRRKSRPPVKSHVRPAVERPVMVERPSFVLTLTKEEIEHDFMLMTGEKPPKKLIKRSRSMQRKFDCLYPGMYLTNITPEKYGVDRDPPLKP